MSQGILDTCVVVDLGLFDLSDLPDDQAITAITLGELSVGPLIANEPGERARRQTRLQEIEHRFAQSILDFDAAAARSYGAVMAGALTRGRTSRGRVADFQIASIAIVNRIPLYTVNVSDFAGIDGLELRAVPAPAPPPTRET